VANTGLVSYRIVDQQLQVPSRCNKTGCDCPDSVEITMGAKKIRLCGSNTPSPTNQLSLDGLHVKFCSDNKYSAKGIHLLAYKHDDVPSSVPVIIEVSCT